MTTTAASPPALSDWPESYVETLRDNELMDMSDGDVLAVLVAEHEPMRFGRHIDLNIQAGFYFEPGDGIADLGQGESVGRLVSVLDSVADGITITRGGEIAWCAAGFEDHYLDRADERLPWVFEKAIGPRLLIAEPRSCGNEDFYFLVVRFLNKADKAAYDAAFPETDA